MQVRNDEGVAIHIGPEPCVGIREGAGEASAGERIGKAIRRDERFPGSRRCTQSGRPHGQARKRERFGRPGVVGDPGMYGRSLDGNREVPRLTVSLAPTVRIGKARSRSR